MSPGDTCEELYLHSNVFNKDNALKKLQSIQQDSVHHNLKDRAIFNIYYYYWSIHN